MKRANPRLKLVPFDAARHLTDDAAIAAYMTAVLETEDSNLLLLAPGAKPRFDTVLKVARALGVRLTARPV